MFVSRLKIDKKSFIILICKIFLVFGIGYTTLSSAQTQDYWTLKAPLPIAQNFWGQHAAVVNNKIYTLGGCANDGTCSVTGNVWEYDPWHDRWTAKRPMPTKRLGVQTAVVNNKIYVIGGSTFGNDVFDVVEEYNPVTDTWRTGLEQ